MNDRTVYQSSSRMHLITTAPDATVFQAACVMTRSETGSVLILNEDGGPIGIFTERDLLTKVVAKSLDPAITPVSEVMTSNPLTVPPEMSVCDALLLMKERRFRHLPIVAPSGKVVGMFSIRDASPREIVDADDIAEHLDVVTEVLA
ncbi:MAG: CBS domain-containing protein [Betaproteobacteria bacterium]